MRIADPLRKSTQVKNSKTNYEIFSFDCHICSFSFAMMCDDAAAAVGDLHAPLDRTSDATSHSLVCHLPCSVKAVKAFDCHVY